VCRGLAGGLGFRGVSSSMEDIGGRLEDNLLCLRMRGDAAACGTCYFISNIHVCSVSPSVALSSPYLPKQAALKVTDTDHQDYYLPLSCLQHSSGVVRSVSVAMEGQVRFARFGRDNEELGGLVHELELELEVEVSLHPDRMDGYPNPNARVQNKCAHQFPQRSPNKLYYTPAVQCNVLHYQFMILMIFFVSSSEIPMAMPCRRSKVLIPKLSKFCVPPEGAVIILVFTTTEDLYIGNLLPEMPPTLDIWHLYVWHLKIENFGGH
jgi:hypothetical protein